MASIAFSPLLSPAPPLHVAASPVTHYHSLLKSRGVGRGEDLMESAIGCSLMELAKARFPEDFVLLPGTLSYYKINESMSG